MRNYSDIGGNYAEDMLMIDLIKSQLPDNMQGRSDMLEVFSNNVDQIREMCQGFAVHEFQSVTIEASMLTIIDSVQNEIS